MEPVTNRAWTWIVKHREWVFSGIGTAILMALIGYFLAQKGGDSAGRDINTITDPKGPAIIQTGKGNVTIESGEKR